MPFAQQSRRTGVSLGTSRVGPEVRLQGPQKLKSFEPSTCNNRARIPRCKLKADLLRYTGSTTWYCFHGLMRRALGDYCHSFEIDRSRDTMRVLQELVFHSCRGEWLLPCVAAMREQEVGASHSVGDPTIDSWQDLRVLDRRSDTLEDATLVSFHAGFRQHNIIPYPKPIDGCWQVRLPTLALHDDLHSAQDGMHLCTSQAGFRTKPLVKVGAFLARRTGNCTCDNLLQDLTFVGEGYCHARTPSIASWYARLRKYSPNQLGWCATQEWWIHKR